MINEKYQLLMIVLLFLGAFYVARRIVCAGTDPSCMRRSRPRRIACAALTALGTACLSYMLFSHLELQIRNASLNRIFVWITGVYVAFFIYYLMTQTAADVICLILRHKGNRTRRARLFTAASVCTAALLTVAGVMHARSIKTVHYDLSLNGQSSVPIRIVEVSDLHMGSVIGTSHVRRVVDAVNACHPDLVVFLGDQFNRTEAVDIVDAEAMFEALSHIEAAIGVYAVLGNHDPELNSEIYQTFLSESGITALDNAVLEIIPGNENGRTEVRTLISASPAGTEAAANPAIPADDAILLVGRTKLAKDAERVPLAKLLDEAEAADGSGSGGREDSRLPSAADSDPGRDKYHLLVLDHDPEGITEAVSCSADLVLAGHTHRGQFFPATLFSWIRYAGGRSYGLTGTVNESSGRVTTGIVSSGAGYFQTPIRIGTDSEIVCVDLRFDQHP